MISLPACTCEAAEHYEKHNQLIKLMQFLMGLDDNYLAIRSNILTREPLPLVKAAFAIVSGEESRRNITSNGANKPAATIIGYPAGYVKKNFIPNSRPVTSNNTTVDPQSNNVNSNATSKSPVSLSNEQLTRLMNLLNENGVFSTNANMSDSGDNQHMIVSAKILINVVDISNLGLTVGHPSGTQTLITKIGDLKLNNNITLYDVLVVPEYTDLKANKTLGIGRQFNGLYLFDLALQDPKRPNDEGRVSSNDDGSELSPDNNNQGNDDSDATSMEETNNTHPKGNSQNEIDFINDFDDSEINSDTEELPVNNLRSSSRQTKLPSSLNNFIVEGKVKYGVERVVSYANLKPDSFYFATALNKSIEPTCYEDVVLDSNWIDAMNSEIEALNGNQTWIITDLPPGRKAIGNKWIYKIKYKSSGDIDRYKARLVVKGCSKKEGVDFDETFSPVVKMSTVRCLIALSVTNNWPLFQLDVNNAFLYGDIDEDIYMTIPKGFANKDNNNKVCKLVKSLYGLKQAPRKWNEKLVTILKENGFIQSINDHSLFTKTKDNKYIALLVYVDDIVVTGNCVNEIDKFKVFLKSKFKIKDLGLLKYFLGIEVIRSDKDLCLTQRKYCLELLKDYGLLGCKQVSTPMVPNSVLSYEPTDDDPLLDNITGYQKLLGKLIYLTYTRPDIAYFVHCLAQHMHSHLSSALNVLRYLKGALGKGIRYQYPDIRDTICGYSDADWAKCLKTRKSVTEYRSLSSATCEIIWIQKLPMDLKAKATLPVDLFCDNKPALQLAVNPVFHERSKHFEIGVHFIREKKLQKGC
ncbi:ribonuclease H-like domain-containing protein [Tanacetum coccineum]